MEHGQTGALIIGGEHPGLAVSRSLGRRGIPVCVVDDQLSISSFSKYVRQCIRVGDLRDERRTVDTILEVGHKFGLRDWVLFPTRDETVAAFSRHRRQLAEFFRVTTPEWDTVRWAYNKKLTYDLANRLDIPCPETFNPRCADDIEALYSKLPLAIKPAVKENFFYATGAKAWRAETPGQLQEMYARAARHIPPAEILVQQIIPGDGHGQVSYCAFFRDNEARGTLVARRARQHPREFGRAATFVETIDLPVIEELSERFLRAINYYGLVEVEFKLDPRDGQYKLLDVNARTWGFHSLGYATGVDFPFLLFADQMGESVEVCRGKAGVGWLRALTDVPTAFGDILHGHLKWQAYVASIKSTKIESVFCKDDLMPSVMEVSLLPYFFSRKYLL